MPIYEYRCGACGRAFERLVHGAAGGPVPRLRQPDVTRLLSLFGMKTGQGFVASAGGAAGRVRLRPRRVRLSLTRGTGAGADRVTRGR